MNYQTLKNKNNHDYTAPAEESDDEMPYLTPENCFDVIQKLLKEKEAE